MSKIHQAVALSLLLAYPCIASTVPASGAAPVRLTANEADTVRRAIETDRADTKKWLETSPTSYLAAVARTDFGAAGSLDIGNAEGCAVRLPDPRIAERQLRVTVVGDSFRVETLAPGTTFHAGERELTAATLPPSSIRVGPYTLRLSHQRFPAIIVFDPEHRRPASSVKQRWYPIDLRYRFVVPLTPNPNPDTTIIQSTRGNQRRAILAGWFELRVKGKPVRLEAHRLLEPGIDEKGVAVFFRDATTGRETYDVGRYVDPEPLADGRWLFDFNNAYNPACAFSEHYNCPIPSKANVLKFAIRVGEKSPERAGH